MTTVPNSPPKAVASPRFHVGDRFREIGRPDRRLELVALLKPRSGIEHARLRVLGDGSQSVLISCQSLAKGGRYRRLTSEDRKP